MWSPTHITFIWSIRLPALILCRQKQFYIYYDEWGKNSLVQEIMNYKYEHEYSHIFSQDPKSNER